MALATGSALGMTASEITSHTGGVKDQPELRDLIDRLAQNLELIHSLNGRLYAARNRLGAGMPHETTEDQKDEPTPQDACAQLRLYIRRLNDLTKTYERTVAEFERLV